MFLMGYPGGAMLYKRIFFIFYFLCFFVHMCVSLGLLLFVLCVVLLGDIGV